MSWILSEFQRAESIYNKAQEQIEALKEEANIGDSTPALPNYPLSAGSWLLHYTRGKLWKDNVTLWLHSNFLRDMEAKELLELIGKDLEKIGGEPKVRVGKVGIKRVYLSPIMGDIPFQKQIRLGDLMLHVGFDDNSEMEIKYEGHRFLRGSQFRVDIHGEKARDPAVYQTLDMIESYKRHR